MKGVFARQVTLMKKIAVLTSGGDAPGMNAAIRAVVRTAVFHDMEVVGVFQGYQGLIDGDFKRLHVRSVAKILGRGGTILKSARVGLPRLEGRKAHINLVEANIDGLVVIGGNGTFTGAMKFGRETGRGPSRHHRQRFERVGFDHWIRYGHQHGDRRRGQNPGHGRQPQPVVLRGGDGP